MASLIGSKVERKEDKKFLTGKGRYTADINLVNQTYAYFVRSPHARANINSVDISKALKAAGVVNIFTGEDTSWPTGANILALNQSVTSEARVQFNREVLGATPKASFKQHYYHSPSMHLFKPKERASDDSVKRFVRRNKKSIGYVYMKNVDDSVKVLTIDGMEPLDKNYILR